VEPHNLYGPNEASIDVTAWRFLAGPGLAFGYLRQPGLTAGRFLPDPYADQPGQRMYAAGDLARWRCDGQLEYLGRTDRQATLRGQRIEPGESERALTACPGVRQAAVILHEHARVAASSPALANPFPARASCASTWRAACPPT
jgi:acyl-coenzyme A synthetase/AMP-(fatty) acid ligase